VYGVLRMNRHVSPLQSGAGTITARITRIETIPLRVKLERPATGSTVRLTHRSTIITRVHTDAGVVGERFNGNDDQLQCAIIRMSHEEMAPRLLGQPAMGVAEAWERMRGSTEPFLRDRRVSLRAMALVDSALHDAAGKLAGLPLHVMWGSAHT